MAWKRIFGRDWGSSKLLVEQDSETGNICVAANIVEMNADDATAFALAITTAAFPHVKSSRKHLKAVAAKG